jgi:capsular polysaccharide biosynthesis protein
MISQRPKTGLPEFAEHILTSAGLHGARNFLRVQYLPFRAGLDWLRGKQPRLKVKKRLDIRNLAGTQLIQKTPGYLFTPKPVPNIVNGSRLLLRQEGVIAESFGARHLALNNSRHTAGWDLIEHSGGATFPQLDSDNEQFIESYVLDQKLVGWNRKHFVYRALQPWEAQYPQEGVVLFGSYMDQWGHFVSDLAFRLIDNIEPTEPYDIFIQEGTPDNARRIIQIFAPHSRLWEVPLGKSIFLKKSTVPLSRTLLPVGWKPRLDPRENGWGWAIDAPAVAKLPKPRPVQPDPEAKPKRLFLDRVQSNVYITNLSEVKALLTEYGFELIQAENWAFDDLLALLDASEVVVAGQGSQLLNLLFASKPTQVVKLTHRLDSVSGISSALVQLGHHCTTIVNDWELMPNGSPYEMKQAPIRAKLDDLKSQLDRILAEPPIQI